MKSYQLLKNKKSQLLITVLLTLAIVLALGAGLLFHSRSFRDVTSLQVDTNQAYSLAESGIDIGESFIEVDVCNPVPIESDEVYSLGEGTVGIAIISTLANEILSGTISSTGTYGRSRRLLEKTFSVPAPMPKGWARAYGQAYRQYSAFQTSDGGYILFGGAASNDGILLIKTDGTGAVEWARCYGSASDKASAILQTDDGGYILGGISPSPVPSYDFFIIEINSSGDFQWATSYEASGSFGAASLQSISQTDDGGYILGARAVCIQTYHDFVLIKTDSSGDATWANYYSNTDYAYLLGCAAQTDDEEGYILAGSRSLGAYGPKEAVLIKTGSSGDVIEWANAYGEGASDDSFFSNYLHQTSDGGYILGGYTESFGAGNQDFLLIKTDDLGNVGASFPETWAQTYGRGGDEQLFSFSPTSDGGYILIGEGYADILLIKTDSSGAATWARTYGDIGSYCWPSSVWQTSDGGYILAAETTLTAGSGYDFLAIKTDSLGDLDCCSLVQSVTPTPNSPWPTVNPLSPTVTPISFTSNPSFTPAVVDFSPTTTVFCPSPD